MLEGKSERLLLVLAVVVLLPALAVADYPAEVPRTGQTTCYDTDGAVIDCAGTGQDGAIQAGAVWPVPRFVDNGDGTVTDGLTGLVWAQDANLMATRDPAFDEDDTAGDGAVTWQHALDYVAKLNSESYLGYDDWGLANKRELLSLIDYGQYKPALPTGHPFIFTNVPFSECHWSSTSEALYPFYAWSVVMSGGQDFNDFKTSDYCVWPVRSGQCGASGASIICLLKTGQTTCYDTDGNVIDCAGTGQDGELQHGIAWPDPRFVDNGDGTVADSLTGLMWAKDANLMATCDPSFDADGMAGDGQVTWQHALDYAAKLNSESYLGYTDWRLPNRSELESLLNYELYNFSLPQDHPFSNVQAYRDYWTSTTRVFQHNAAWTVSMNLGKISFSYKTSCYCVWPVRAGQVGNPLFSSTTTTVAGGSTTTTTASSDTTTTTTTAGDTTTTTTAGGDEPCPATQVLGADNPQLDDLRGFRDGTLAHSSVGRCIISLYYRNADAINAALERSPFLRAMARRVFDAAALAVGP